MKLVIAEKPSLGKSIAEAIPGTATIKNGCIMKGNYVITWVYGHMLSLKEPEDFNPNYKAWSLDSLPIFFENWEQKIGEDSVKKSGQQTKKERVTQLGKLLKQADIVIHAGDPDEEGQLLIDELLRWFHYDGPVYRLDTANTVKDAMEKSLHNLKDNKLLENEGWSAYARSVADMTVGVNMSRFFSLKNNTLLTIGRVQTPTLGLVVNRDYLIENHVKTTYYKLLCTLNINRKEVSSEFVLAKDDPNLTDGKCLNRQYLQQKANVLSGRQIDNIVIKKKKEKEQPPLPFNLVKLQSYCGSRWGYSPSDVMDITQHLREDYQAITYNRSDCQFLSEEHFAEAPQVVAAVTRNLCYHRGSFDTSIKSKCFNSDNITAHFAIIPTTAKVNLESFSEKERNVYVAICHYYLAQFLPPAEKEKTTLFVDLGKQECLKAVSTVITKQGYRLLLKIKQTDDDTALSGFAEGIYAGGVFETKIVENETKPPARYTKSSLNEDMTCIAKYVENPKIRGLLLEKDKDKKGENGSIGTSATRASIIDNLIIRGFLEEKGKKLISTPLGRELFRILPDEIKKADMTARWWVLQEDIRSGKSHYSVLTHSVLDTVTHIIHSQYPMINQSLISNGQKKDSNNKVIGKCPKCGADVISNNKGFFCKADNCDFALWPTMRYFSNELKITETKAKSLLAGKKTVFSLKGKSGNTYEGYLKIKINGKYVNFEPNGYPKKKKG